jgi:DNA repair protein RadC
MTAATVIDLPAPALIGDRSPARPSPAALRRRSEAELIAQVLGGTHPPAASLRCYAQELARLPFWERRALSMEALVSTYGIPEAHAARLVALWELADRWFPDDRPVITSPREAALLLSSQLASAGTETAMALLLDARYRVIASETVAVGGVNVARLQPRDVFGRALHTGANAIILAHNHPSGDPTPSRSDRLVTLALRECAAIVGVAMLDHLVLAGSRYHSFAHDEGWTDSPAWTADDSDSVY